MVHNPGEKLKKPQTALDIQSIQDELSILEQEIRDIRVGMQECGLDSLELKVGTFRFYLGKLREIAIDWKSEFTKQSIRVKMDAVRERKRKELEAKKKNNK